MATLQYMSSFAMANNLQCGVGEKSDVAIPGIHLDVSSICQQKINELYLQSTTVKLYRSLEYLNTEEDH